MNKSRLFATIIRMERSIVLLDNHHIEKLHQVARRHRVTASWVLRTLYQTHRDYAVLHQPQRPKVLLTHCSPFSLCWHGDRKAVRDFLWDHQLELSAVIRFLLEMYLLGKIDVDLGDVYLVKREYSPQTDGILATHSAIWCRTMHLSKTNLFQEDQYWPINHRSLLALAAWGRSRRRYKRKYGLK